MERVTEEPRRALRRLPPDPVQLQVILGSLLAGARFEGRRGERRMRIAHAAKRAGYIRWKYERLGPLAEDPPKARDARLELRTIAHPLFDDLAALRRSAVHELLAPLGLAVYLTDLGRLELRDETFLPAQRLAALAAA